MQKAIPSLYPSWLFAWAIEKCWRTRNTVPGILIGNWLPRTAAQQGINCHQTASYLHEKSRTPPACYLPCAFVMTPLVYQCSSASETDTSTGGQQLPSLGILSIVQWGILDYSPCRIDTSVMWEYNTMPQSVVELAKELTLVLIQTGNLTAEDIQDTLQRTYATLAMLKAQEESGILPTVPLAETPPVDWRKSITKHTITCLECGDTFKQLSIRHLLRLHGLDSRSYRTKYGIPQSVPLAARATTERRRQVVREIRPWEQAPMYRKGQARNGHRTPELETETVPEETKASSAEAPAQPKRQRKTSSKKTARKTRSALFNSPCKKPGRVKGGNGFLHDFGVLPSVGSTNHCRPLRTQMGASMWEWRVRRIKG